MDMTPTLPEKRRSNTMSFVFLALSVILFVAAYLIGINDNPPGIVALLAGFVAVILAGFYRFGKPGKRTPVQQLLYWTPRALCIAFAGFISMFALDVFNEGQGIWGTILALLMHLIPTFLILVVLALSWRREWIAGTVFIALAALYVISVWNKPSGIWSGILLLAGPLILTGALFLLNWHYRDALRGSSS